MTTEEDDEFKITTTGEMIRLIENDETDAVETPDVDESKPAAAPRPFDIGVVYDSAGDGARLTLVTKYAGSRRRCMHIRRTGGTMRYMGTKSNTINHDGGVPDYLPKSRCWKETVPDVPVGGHATASTAEAATTTIYSYKNGEDVKVYVRHSTGSTTDAAGDSVFSYRSGRCQRVGTAKIPDGADYNHIHFGLWTGLGEADEDGAERGYRSRHRLGPERHRQSRDDGGR